MKYLNLNVKTWLILWMATPAISLGLSGQVAVGLDVCPEKAALLQLKDKQAAPGTKEATAAKGGLLLPRVELAGMNEFTLIASPTEAQKKDHTGLLVYNLKIDAEHRLEKGVYQWDGDKWRILQKTTKTEGIAVKKSIYRAKTPIDTCIAKLGLFEFRIALSRRNDYTSQFRLAQGTAMPEKKIYGLLNWDRDRSIDYESRGWLNLKNNDFEFSTRLFSIGDGLWCDIMTWNQNTEKHEMWVSDMDNDHIYHVQFLVFGDNDDPKELKETKLYGIIVKRY
jgi:hypothetical protein